MSLTVKPVVAKRRFATLAYQDGGELAPQPLKPDQCPEHSRDEGACRIHIKERRLRVHGPSFALVEMTCLTHGRSFTVYPLGWYPYGRQPLVHVGRDGFAVEMEEGEDEWQETAFAAAACTAADEVWPEEASLGPTPTSHLGPVRRTQRRQLHGALSLLRLSPSATQPAQESAARLLGIDLTLLVYGAQRARDGPLAVQGQECVKVLQKLTARDRSLVALLKLGSACAFWGPPYKA